MNRLAPDTHTLGTGRASVRNTMAHVMLALVPGTLVYALIIDIRILGNILFACLFALGCEALCLKLRNRALMPTLSDGSVILAAWLLSLCLPPSLPFWQIAIGIFTLVALGKQVFGGLGHNPFNPAMVAFAVLIISFPITMTNWHSSGNGLIDRLSNAELSSSKASGIADTAAAWDGLTGATAMDRLRQIKRSEQLSKAQEHLVSLQKHGKDTKQANNKESQRLTSDVASSWLMASGWIWVNLGWLAGGLYLLANRTISWHIPAATLGSIAVLYALSSITGSMTVLPVLPALMSGAILFGAFFIATDPVTSAASRQGQLIYGCGIGLLTFIIREFSVFPEGFAFAVLLMNICVPLIDHFSIRARGNVRWPGKSR